MTGPDPVADQLVWSLAREVAPGDVVIVGVGTPMATSAALLAREMLGTDVTVIVAASVAPPVHDVAAAMLDPASIARTATGTYSQTEVLDAIQRGRVTLQFVSPVEVDRWGHCNTSRVRDRDGTGLRRLPGGLATGDVSVLVGRLVAYRARHGPRFLPHEVAFTSGAGHDRGRDWRAAAGLPGRGVRTFVTDRAVLRWDDHRRGFALASVHAGEDPDDVVSATGFALHVGDVAVTEPPPLEATRLLDEVIDPHGTRRLETPHGRDAARATLSALARPMTPPS